MGMIGKVRRMYFREKKSVREIVRLTSLSRITVRKWLKAAVLEEPKYRRSEAPGKLTAHHETLKLALKADAHRPGHEWRTARALYERIRRDGYAGCYSRVTDFVRAWRQGEGQSISTKAFVPLTFELGEAFQFDWSEEAWWSAASTTACRSRTSSCVPAESSGSWPTRARATRCCSTHTPARSRRWVASPDAASTTT